MRKTTTAETYRSNGFGRWSLLPAIMDVTSGAIECRRRKIYSPCGSASIEDTQQITKFHITNNKMKNRSSSSLVRQTAIILRQGLNYSPSSERKQLYVPGWRKRVLKGSISTCFWVIFFLLLSLTAPCTARDITITVHPNRASLIEVDGLNTAQRHGGYHVPDPVEYNVVPAPIAPAPRRRPVTLPPTSKPTFKPTFELTSKPTFEPTSKPSIAQNPISPPTPKPSIARNPIPPQLSPEAPASPTYKKNPTSGNSAVVNKKEHAAVENGKTAERWKDVTVPIDFTMNTIVTTPTTFDDVRILLEEMVLQDLLEWESTAYADNIVKVAHVSLDPALAEGYNKVGRRRRLRVLQQSETVLRVTGFTVVKVDSDSIDPEQVYNDINKELDENILVPDNIQSALEPVGLQVTQVQNLLPPKTTSDVEEEKKTTSDVEETKKAAYTGRIPSTTDIVFAILIIIVASASLVFWARVLWKRRQKRLKKRRLNAIRRSQSEAVRDMMHSQKQYSQPNNSNNDRNPPHGNRHNTDNESSSSGSGFQRFGPFEDSNDNRMQDSFAAELREAATLDELAWSKGKPKNIRSPYYANVGNSLDRYRARIDNSDQQGNQTGTRSNELESGYGNYPIKSFPYGDEMDPPIAAGSSPPSIRVMHLLSGDEKKDDSDVEVPTNYNDKNHLQQSLEKKLYLQESPILAGNNKAQKKSSISFGSQQKTKHLTVEKELRRSPEKSNKDNNEETKRRKSSLNASPMSSLKNLMLFNKQSDDASDNDSSDSESHASVMTMEMLEEVKQLSHYMQRYEERNVLGNEQRDSFSEDKDDDMAPGNSFIKEAGLSLSATMGAARDLLYRHSNFTSGGEGKADFQDLKLRKTSYSDDDEDTPTTADSQRLGIKRSPNRPQSPKLISLRKKVAILDGEIVDE